MRKAVNLNFLIITLLIFSPWARALTPEVLDALDSYILEKKTGNAETVKQLAEAKKDVDELESRILPAIMALNRTVPLINKRVTDIEALEKNMAEASTRMVNPYSDAAWVAQVRSQALAVCCAIRAQPSLMREVQDNLVNGVPPLSEASLAKIAEIAKSATVKGAAVKKANDESDEIVPSRPFVSRPKDEEGPRRRGVSRGIISGLPDLQPPPTPKLEEPPQRPPAPAPAPAPPVSP